MEKYMDKDFLLEELIVNDKTYKEVANQIGCNVITLTKWAKKLGVERLPEYLQLNGKYGKEIVRMYVEEKVFATDIAKHFSVNHYSTIQMVLKYNGVDLMERSEIKAVADKRNMCRKYSLNTDYFRKWSHNMAYILGFISADGVVYIQRSGNKTGYRMEIGLKNDESNYKLLNAIKSELGYNGKLERKTTKTGETDCEVIRLTITSKDLVESLIELGVTERKSNTIRTPVIPKEFRMDYLRGYFDGDGSIEITYPTNKGKGRSLTPQLRFRICSGSPLLLEDLLDIIHEGSNGEIPRKNVSSQHKNKKLWDIEYSTKSGLKLYNLMYYDDCICLERKRNVFEKCISLRSL